MSIKPSLPKGTRDFMPEAMQKREFILTTIKTVFRKYGFQPIETPAMENLNTLTGKYGEEGDKLIFKILNSGDFLKKSDRAAFADDNSNAFGVSVSDKALRYDLTVPFARFVVQNQNDLTFPFKRYQIQPVWRADRPQKGRFREFYQCDADAVGSDSLLMELEFIRMYDEVFKKLQVPAAIHMNNRKLLAGLAEVMGIGDRLTEFTVILDKLDKIGNEGVANELKEKGFSEKAATMLFNILSTKGSNAEKMEVFKNTLSGNAMGEKGLEELEFVLKNLDSLKLTNDVVLDVSLARGLDYYTGAIFEVKPVGVEMGSIGGGGRYDDLTGIFGMKNLSGIGISFGLDRIQLVMEELSLFPEMDGNSTEVLFVNFGEAESLYSLTFANELRDLGVKAEVYPDSSKMKKQLDFANKKNIPNVILIGSNEMQAEKYTMKNMLDGTQQDYSRIEILEYFSNHKNSNYGLH
jgi:histidyl-tRNA synthetase